jgi:protein O-mannosyl-transferase
VLAGWMFELLTRARATAQVKIATPLWAVCAAALWFALHPVATYAVGYLVQRTMVMGALFAVLALWCYVRGSGRASSMWLVLSVGFYYLAVFAKEHLIMLPAVMGAMTVLLHADWRVKLKQTWWVWMALAGIALLAVLARQGLMGAVYEINGTGMLAQLAHTPHAQSAAVSVGAPVVVSAYSVHFLSVLTQAGLFFKYAALWLLPNTAWMSIDMREPFAQSPWSLYGLGLMGYVAWGGAAIYLLLQRGEKGLVGFALLFPWLMFVTEFSAVRVQESFVLYRSYAWAVGAFCLVPVVLGRLRGRMVWVLMLVLTPTLFVLSMERLKTLSHPVLLWDDAEKLVTGRNDLLFAERIYYNRGTELVKIYQHNAAIADFKRAIELHPSFTDAYANLGAAYLGQKKWAEAAAGFEQAIRLDAADNKPPNPHYYYGRALAYEGLGEVKKAQADYRKTCELDNKGCDKAGVGKPPSSPHPP